MKANYLLIQNIQALLAARGEDAKSLATWAGHRPAWLSKILSGERGIKLDDLDKIADFFGLTVAELFQPGISPMTERRRAQRRSGNDRRSGHDRRQGKRKDRDSVHPDLTLRFPTSRKQDQDRQTDSYKELRFVRREKPGLDGSGDGSGGESTH